MIKRRNSLIMLLFIILATLVLSACSDSQSGRTYTIGVVNSNEEHEKVFQGFKKGLEASGYTEGRNISYIYNGPRTKMSDLENDLGLFISQKVDLIFSITTPATIKTKIMTAGTDIPVVFAPVYDPVKSGIVESLMNPGGNLTGIKVGGNSAKALYWLLQISPEIKKISVPFNSNNKATLQSLQGLQEAASKFGVTLAAHEVHSKKDLELFFSNLPEGTDALFLLNSFFLVKHIEMFVDTAVKHGLPLGSSTSHVSGGVLITYGQNAFRTGELAADMAHEILQGRAPDSLPVEITDFFLGINLTTAEAIGIDISDDILHVADSIIRP